MYRQILVFSDAQGRSSTHHPNLDSAFINRSFNKLCNLQYWKILMNEFILPQIRLGRFRLRLYIQESIFDYSLFHQHSNSR